MLLLRRLYRPAIFAVNQTDLKHVSSLSMLFQNRIVVSCCYCRIGLHVLKIGSRDR